MRYLPIVWALCCIAATAAAGTEQLIVLIQDRPTEVARRFRTDFLPPIERLAGELGVTVAVRAVSDQAPAEVAITPLLIFQNARGRSIYQGRPNTLDRIRNFIRTARHVPQGSTALSRVHTAVWSMGRATIWAPVKITPLSGSLPEAFDPEAFRKEALQAVYSGFRHFRVVSEVELGRADRGFYLDVYPYRSREGVLFLSLAVYSQFHCHHPVYHTGDTPLMGSWEQRGRLFEEAARKMEAVVREKAADPFGGDGFDPVDGRVAAVTWEEFGFPLPPADPTESRRFVGDEIPRHWKLRSPAPLDPPLIQFRFPPPLDNHAGEVVDGTGEFHLPGDLQAGAATGSIQVQAASVTMGQKELDQFIHGSMVLNAARFPVASFTITAGDDEGEIPAFGRLCRVAYSGNFSMKGKTMPLNAALEIEPVVTAEGEKRLLMRGGFQIDLKAFDIQGPDGPEPANHLLLFDVHFTLEPAETAPGVSNGNS
ncbi:MAG: YceI family protein [Thermodesulfobacteriota bacterium]